MNSYWNGENIAHTLTKNNANGAQRMPDKDNFNAVITTQHNTTPMKTEPISIDMRNAMRDADKHDAINRQGVGVGEPGEAAHTLSTAHVNAVAHMKTEPISIKTSNTMSNGSNVSDEGVAYTLDQAQGQAVASSMQIRRLSVTECSRLQGFPDSYVRIPWRGKPADQCPDGPCYRALGNSMAVPVISWLGKRIQMVEDIIKESK